MITEEREIVFHSLANPDTSIKFFTSPKYVLVENKSLVRFIVDEAHCVDIWGQNFRPSYSELGNLRQFGRPMAAFTGTATKLTKGWIVEKLGLVDAVVEVERSTIAKVIETQPLLARVLDHFCQLKEVDRG